MAVPLLARLNFRRAGPICRPGIVQSCIADGNATARSLRNLGPLPAMTFPTMTLLADTDPRPDFLHHDFTRPLGDVDGRGAPRIAGPDLGRYARDRRNVRSAQASAAASAPAIVLAAGTGRATGRQKAGGTATAGSRPQASAGADTVHRRRGRRRHRPGHAGGAVLGGFGDRFQECAAGAAGTLARSLQRRFRRRVRRRIAQWPRARPASGPITRSSPASAPVR